MDELRDFLRADRTEQPFRLGAFAPEQRRTLVALAGEQGIAVVDVHDAAQRGLSSELEMFVLIARALAVEELGGSLSELLHAIALRLLESPTPRVLIVRCLNEDFWRS